MAPNRRLYGDNQQNPAGRAVRVDTNADKWSAAGCSVTPATHFATESSGIEPAQSQTRPPTRVVSPISTLEISYSSISEIG